jgi:hypothetical protein
MNVILDALECRLRELNRSCANLSGLGERYERARNDREALLLEIEKHRALTQFELSCLSTEKRRARA